MALVLAFSTIYLAWGSTYLCMKIAAGTMPPFAMAAVRFLVAGTLLFGLNAARGLRPPTARAWRDHLGIGVLLLLGGNGLVAWAGQFIPSGVTALLLGMSPAFMVLVEWLWPGGSRPGGVTVAGLALGMAGAAWLAAPWESALDGGLPLGALTAIVAACVAWAIGSIAARRRSGTPLPVAAGVQMLGGGLGLAAVSWALGEGNALQVTHISRASWLAWLYLVVVALIAFPTYGWLIRNSTPARVSTYAYVNPVVAVILGWLVLDEPISVRTAGATAIIVLSVVLIKLPPGALAPRREASARPPEVPGAEEQAGAMLPSLAGRAGVSAGNDLREAA